MNFYQWFFVYYLDNIRKFAIVFIVSRAIKTFSSTNEIRCRSFKRPFAYNRYKFSGSLIVIYFM